VKLNYATLRYLSELFSRQVRVFNCPTQRLFNCQKNGPLLHFKVALKAARNGNSMLICHFPEQKPRSSNFDDLSQRISSSISEPNANFFE